MFYEIKNDLVGSFQLEAGQNMIQNHPQNTTYEII